MRTKPAKTRALAPVNRFCVLDSLGSTELDFVKGCFVVVVAAPFPPEVLLLFARIWRNELRDVKYKADPKPVRSAEGMVPRQRLVTGCGPERIVFRTVGSEEDRDCWTRVLRRSAGWRRTALDTPEVRPARKWK